MMKKKFVLEWKENQFWNKGLLTKYENGIKVESWRINLYYTIKDDFFFIHGVTGGQGTGYSEGCILNKIYIGDAEFEKVNILLVK